MVTGQGDIRLNPDAALLRLRNIRRRCGVGLTNVHKRKNWTEGQRQLAKVELAYEVAALDMAIACIERHRDTIVISLPGRDPASFGGA